MIITLIILHLIDAILTWKYGRNTEFGILFVNIINKGFWWFWVCRVLFMIVVIFGCWLYQIIYHDTHLYWGAIGGQFMVIYMLYAQWARNNRK